jgi:hypothetical protein
MLSTKAAGCFLVAVAFTSALLLQGCGGGATTTKAPVATTAAPPGTTGAKPTEPAGTTGTTVPPTTTAPRTTPERPTRTSPTKAMTSEAAAAYLNGLYFGYKFPIVPGDTESPLGVTMSFAGDPSSFSANLYCKPQMLKTDCYGGRADCRMSAAILNWKMINNDYTFVPVMKRQVAYVFHPDMVEKVAGKCFYPFDGSDFYRINQGCGEQLSASADCSDKKSAFWNICPSNGGEVCKGSETEVTNRMCKPDGPVTPPETKTQTTCFFRGVALAKDSPGKSDLRAMVNHRMEMELKHGDYATWNEVVLDNQLLIPAIWKDPAAAIPAFLVTKSSGNGGLGIAKAMQKEFHEYFKFEDTIPIVQVNDVDKFCSNEDCGQVANRHGPFFPITNAELEGIDEIAV